MYEYVQASDNVHQYLISLQCIVSNGHFSPTFALGKCLKFKMAAALLGQRENSHYYGTSQDINMCNSSISISIWRSIHQNYFWSSRSYRFTAKEKWPYNDCQIYGIKQYQIWNASILILFQLLLRIYTTKSNQSPWNLYSKWLPNCNKAKICNYWRRGTCTGIWQRPSCRWFL